MPFPKAKDYHKSEQPLVPNCYGIFYALISVCYWFALSFLIDIPNLIPNLGVTKDELLALSVSVLFGSTMGLFDDIADLRWRYKTILPIFAALPYTVLRPSDRTTISLLLVGVVDLGGLFFILLVPAIVTITTNAYNQLGGLNGLESLSGLIILTGLTLASGNYALTIAPIVCLMVLGYLSYNGRLFIGNVGTFSIGLTLAIYATLMNVKLFLLIALSPFILNSVLIILSNYILHDKADTQIDEENRLYASKIRSLRTLLIHYWPMTEKKLVIVLCTIVWFSTVIGLLQEFL